MATDPIMPSEVSTHLGAFDRFATAASALASKAWFFVFCVLLVAVWAPSIAILRDIDTWQLIINTATTIVTFLMVALLQNSQARADMALQHKLNAISDALADLMEGENHPKDAAELREAVGLEGRESSSQNAVADALSDK